MEASGRRLGVLHSHLKQHDASRDALIAQPCAAAAAVAAGKGGGTVVLVGGMVMDLQAHPSGPADVQRGGSVPGSVTQSAGGVARNVGEALALLLKSCGSPAAQLPLLVSAVGRDMAGQALLQHWRSLGLSTGCIATLAGGATPTVTVVFDLGGEVAACVADVALLERQLAPALLRAPAVAAALAAAPVVMLDGNLSEAALEEVCRQAAAARVPVWFEPVSVPKSVRAVPFISLLTYASPNEKELAAMAAAVRQQQQQTQQLAPQHGCCSATASRDGCCGCGSAGGRGCCGSGCGSGKGCCSSGGAGSGSGCAGSKGCCGSGCASGNGCCDRAGSRGCCCNAGGEGCCDSACSGASSSNLAAAPRCCSPAAGGSCCGNPVPGIAAATPGQPQAAPGPAATLSTLVPDIATLLLAGLKHLVLTLGPDGAAVCSLAPGRRSIEVCHVPALPATVANCSGAGDCLVAGCLFGLTQGLQVAEALCCGVAAAREAVHSPANVPAGLQAAVVQAGAATARTGSTAMRMPLPACCTGCCCCCGSI